MGPCAEAFALGGKESVLIPLDQSCGCCSGQRATLIAVPPTCRGLRETKFTPWGPKGQDPRGTQTAGWELEVGNSGRHI